MNKIWKVLEVPSKDLEVTLNTLSKSHEIFSVFAHGITVTIVAWQEAKPRKSNAK